MKNQRTPNVVIRLLSALALALVIASPAQVRSAEPAEAKNKMDAQMMERCQEMKEQRQKMMADMKAQDAQLTERVAEMNRAPEGKKSGLMAAILTRMVEQQTAMHEQMEKMQAGMMKHMMSHMRMGMDSMSECPMMKDGKGMGDNLAAEGKDMTSARMMERCQAMKEQKQKMMAEMKAQDAQLAERVAEMNRTPEDKKTGLMAAVVTRMVEQQTAKHTRMETMQTDMMTHMMQHMQMGKDSMAECPMMKDMKGMGDKSAPEGKDMTSAQMMERCQAMKEQKQKLMAEMKAQDAQLTEQVAEMNRAPEDTKTGLMAAVLTRMVEQQTAMHTRMETMHTEMMTHMMQHMQMGKDSMAECPMMKGMEGMKGMKGMEGMEGMKGMDDKSAGPRKERPAEKK